MINPMDEHLFGEYIRAVDPGHGGDFASMAEALYPLYRGVTQKLKRQGEATHKHVYRDAIVIEAVCRFIKAYLQRSGWRSWVKVRDVIEQQLIVSVGLPEVAIGVRHVAIDLPVKYKPDVSGLEEEGYAELPASPWDGRPLAYTLDSRRDVIYERLILQLSERLARPLFTRLREQTEVVSHRTLPYEFGYLWKAGSELPVALRGGHVFRLKHVAATPKVFIPEGSERVRIGEKEVTYSNNNDSFCWTVQRQMDDRFYWRLYNRKEDDSPTVPLIAPLEHPMSRECSWVGGQLVPLYSEIFKRYPELTPNPNRQWELELTEDIMLGINKQLHIKPFMAGATPELKEKLNAYTER